MTYFLFLSRQKVALLIILTTFFISCSGSETGFNNAEVLNHVSAQMKAQEESWNKGDLEGFMEAYWKSDSLMFVGKSGITKGWNQTLTNYKNSYKNKEEMGTLNFTNKLMDFVDEETIFVIGKWNLTRLDSLGDLSGHYSLIWKLKNNKWVIITDHSS